MAKMAMEFCLVFNKYFTFFICLICLIMISRASELRNSSMKSEAIGVKKNNEIGYNASNTPDEHSTNMMNLPQFNHLGEPFKFLKIPPNSHHFRLYCPILGSNEDLNITWLRNEITVTKNTSCLSPLKEELWMKGCSLKEPANYTCIVCNTVGCANLTLIVDFEPEVNIVIFLGILSIIIIIIIGVTALLCVHQKKKRKMLAYNTAMNNFTKVITVDQPLNENSKEPLGLPIIKLERQPVSNMYYVSEYQLPRDQICEFSRKNLKFEQIIGEGAYGVVYKAQAYGITKKGVATTVAVKMLKATHTDSDMINLVIEMEVMKMMGIHKNILRLIGCCTQGGPLMVIIEYVSRGNLKDFLTQYRVSCRSVESIREHFTNGNTLSEKTLISFALQIASGMEYLAFKRYVHRDLAARNILVSEDLVMKIADFGLTRNIHCNDYYKISRNDILPIKWLAPESLCEGVFTKQSDIWSYGILLWEIMTLGDTPYRSITTDFNLAQRLFSGYRMEKPSGCSEKMYEVMRDCWNFEPNDRPIFSDLVKRITKILEETSSENDEPMSIGLPHMDTFTPISSI